jgi:hypothetical protein
MQRLALVVGVTQYSKLGLGNFPSFANNANAVADILEPTFKVRRLPATPDGGCVRVGKSDVTCDRLQNELKELFTATDLDVVLFYFSGHGLKGKQLFPRTYLAASNSEGLDDGYRRAFEIEDLKSLLKNCPAKEQIVWLDCCYGGDLANFQEICDRNDGKTRFIITASRSQDPAYQEIDGEMGVFTRVLVEALARTGTTGRRITCAAIEDAVREKLQTLQYPQMPQFYRNKLIEFWERIVPTTHHYFVPINEYSLFIDRSDFEYECYRIIAIPRQLIRISSARRTGKTWLLDKVIAYSKVNLGYKTVKFQCEPSMSEPEYDNDRFLKYFCSYISQELDIKDLTESYWTKNGKPSDKATSYLQIYILDKINDALVIGIDNFEYIFPNVNLFKIFAPLLRTWYEKGADTNNPWKKLRLIVVHSTEKYPELDINRSPFAVGTRIKIGGFTLEETKKICGKYEINDIKEKDLNRLINLVNGHPYLINQAFTYLSKFLRSKSLESAEIETAMNKLLKTAGTEEGEAFIYHLRELLDDLEKNHLKGAYQKVLLEKRIKFDDTILRFKLDSLGLTKFVDGDFSTPFCPLYSKYFLSK